MTFNFHFARRFPLPLWVRGAGAALVASGARAGRCQFHFARWLVCPLTGLSNSGPDRVFSSRDRRFHRLGWSWSRCPFLALTASFLALAFALTARAQDTEALNDQLNTTTGARTVNMLGWVQIPNTSPDAVIQASLNANTNNGVITIEQGDYNLSTALVITNGGRIQGNGATFHWTNATAMALTGPMFDTGTNFGKPLIIDGLNFDGGVYESYNSSSYYDNTHLIANGFFGDVFWSNRTALRIEASGGAVVCNCRFSGWSGNGILALNDAADDAGSTLSPRLTITHNFFQTNFAAIFLPGSAFETPGFNNSPSGSWNAINPDYSIITGNQILGCQNGIVGDCPNDDIENNIATHNYIGIIQNGLNGHSLVIGNNLNHNTISYFYVGSGQGFPAVIGNTMIAPVTDSAMCDAGTSIDFEHNFVSGPVVFTNGCTGTVMHNRTFPTDPWGTGAVTTNFTGSTMVQADNFSQDGSLNDGTALSLLEFANTPIFQLTNKPSLSLIPTNGLVVWNSNGVSSTNSLYATINSNGVSVTYHLMCQP